MKKICVTVYLFALALMVFAMSGCGGSSGGDVKLNQQSQTQEEQQTTTQSAQSRTMVIKSPALKRNGKYSLFRGNDVVLLGTSAKYYAAPASVVSRDGETLTMNLEYSSAVSEDLPFVLTDSDDRTVIFAYNPNGTGEDTSSIVYRIEGTKLKYTNLTLTGSSVELEDSEGIIDIVLNSDGTATAGGTSIPVYDYIWHADPQHPAEYWTLSGDSTELDSDAYEEAIESAGTKNGLYIAHDVRYTSNTLNFTTSNTATKDEDTEYVVYYDFTQEAVREGLAANLTKYNLGSEYSSDKYIFATLPMSMGMGGAPGGTMPSGDRPGEPPSAPGSDTRLPVMGSFAAAADSSIASFSTMTHSSADAYANPVLHITEPGTYRLSGTWKGQIWIDVGKTSEDVVGLILSGVNVECTVAPALVFYKVYKWAEDNGYDDQSTLAANDLWKNIGDKMLSGDYYINGAIVEVADGTTNTFTGANTYRILELCPKLDDDDNPKYTGSSIKIGTDIGQQEKMYKLDGAFHSRRTMVIGGGANGTGTLNITSSTYEGLDSEMHMLINGGNITVTAPDDAINVNEDYVSVFQMDSGTMTISSTNADGIDSNGWIAINGGTVNITAGNTRIGSAGESGMDAENADPYISSNATYNWTAASGSGGGSQPPSTGGTTSGDQSGSTGGTTSGDQSGSTGGTTSGDQSGSTGTGTGTTVKTLAVTPTTQPVGDATFTLFPEDGTLDVDTEGERTIPSSSATFELQHRVNDFAGITTN